MMKSGKHGLLRQNAKNSSFSRGERMVMIRPGASRSETPFKVR
ncbi:hypothetical protein QJQ58_27810 [Paenibacillus dendritiformis]|nr:hypothetical protein [Paenibacillus dendritiformis]WGU94254.1 hypothetical protein QJQ58_27810 [Paenibacillus dendritiformis]